MREIRVKINDHNALQNILGEQDKNLLQIKDYFKTEIIVNPPHILVDSQDEDLLFRVNNLFHTLSVLDSMKVPLKERDVRYILCSLDEIDKDEIIEFYQRREEIVKNYFGKSIYPKTLAQKRYIKTLDKNTIIFSVGVAGVGKTYVAIAHAVRELKAGHFKKLILSRPVVEAGESLGYLPGDLKEKIDPYLVPLYDALYELLGKRLTEDYINDGIIEIAPLAYMRGRTLEDAYVVLDEAQNTTKKQMKLFLTRLGFNSKMVITGDLTQVDLVKPNDSGLNYAITRLENIRGLKIFKFDLKDVVRNPLVERIIERLNDD
ncbi:MAG: PhoH family protein [Gammaproteobacteria bacterium]|nr:PhoH family protein [Gammaproteobacteria bacterium]